jgi:hypothetical protein
LVKPNLSFGRPSEFFFTEPEGEGLRAEQARAANVAQTSLTCAECKHRAQGEVKAFLRLSSFFSDAATRPFPVARSCEEYEYGPPESTKKNKRE